MSSSNNSQSTEERPGKAVVTRFAPSPTGLLHLGHAYSAILNHDTAREVDGTFILRIENIDWQRCKAEFEQAITADLTWLGLDWAHPVLRQSERLDHYQSRLDRLKADGLIYRCFLSRKDIAEALSAPHLSPHQPFVGSALPAAQENELLSQGLPFTWRLSLAAAAKKLGSLYHNLSYLEETNERTIERPARLQVFGDVIIARKDLGTSYHLSSVVDDAEQGVTHVIRGEELREVASLHRLLQTLLDLPAPLYRHHKLITDEQGRRLSKRQGSLSLHMLRENGQTPGDIRRRLGFD